MKLRSINKRSCKNQGQLDTKLKRACVLVEKLKLKKFTKQEAGKKITNRKRKTSVSNFFPAEEGVWKEENVAATATHRINSRIVKGEKVLVKEVSSKRKKSYTYDQQDRSGSDTKCYSFECNSSSRRVVSCAQVRNNLEENVFQDSVVGEVAVPPYPPDKSHNDKNKKIMESISDGRKRRKNSQSHCKFCHFKKESTKTNWVTTNCYVHKNKSLCSKDSEFANIVTNMGIKNTKRRRRCSKRLQCKSRDNERYDSTDDSLTENQEGRQTESIIVSSFSSSLKENQQKCSNEEKYLNENKCNDFSLEHFLLDLRNKWGKNKEIVDFIRHSDPIIYDPESVYSSERSVDCSCEKHFVCELNKVSKQNFKTGVYSANEKVERNDTVPECLSPSSSVSSFNESNDTSNTLSTTYQSIRDISSKTNEYQHFPMNIDFFQSSINVERNNSNKLGNNICMNDIFLNRNCVENSSTQCKSKEKVVFVKGHTKSIQNNSVPRRFKLKREFKNNCSLISNSISDPTSNPEFKSKPESTLNVVISSPSRSVSDTVAKCLNDSSLSDITGVEFSGPSHCNGDCIRCPNSLCSNKMAHNHPRAIVGISSSSASTVNSPPLMTSSPSGNCHKPLESVYYNDNSNECNLLQERNEVSKKLRSKENKRTKLLSTRKVELECVNRLLLVPSVQLSRNPTETKHSISTNSKSKPLCVSNLDAASFRVPSTFVDKSQPKKTDRNSSFPRSPLDSDSHKTNQNICQAANINSFPEECHPEETDIFKKPAPPLPPPIKQASRIKVVINNEGSKDGELDQDDGSDEDVLSLFADPMDDALDWEEPVLAKNNCVNENKVAAENTCSLNELKGISEKRGEKRSEKECAEKVSPLVEENQDDLFDDDCLLIQKESHLINEGYVVDSESDCLALTDLWIDLKNEQDSIWKQDGSSAFFSDDTDNDCESTIKTESETIYTTECSTPISSKAGFFQKPCFQYLRNGNCFNEKCKYLHEERECSTPLSSKAGFFQNYCFQYLRNGSCFNGKCRYLHEVPVPDLEQLSSSFKDVMLLATFRKFHYFLKKNFTTLTSMGATQKIVEVLMLLLEKYNLKESLDAFKIFSELHVLFPNVLLESLIDNIISKPHSRIFCRDLFDNVFRNINKINFKDIAPLMLERFARKLDNYGLKEQADFLKSQLMDRSASVNSEIQSSHYPVNAVGIRINKQNQFVNSLKEKIERNIITSHKGEMHSYSEPVMEVTGQNDITGHLKNGQNMIQSSTNENNMQFNLNQKEGNVFKTPLNRTVIQNSIPGNVNASSLKERSAHAQFSAGQYVGHYPVCSTNIGNSEQSDFESPMEDNVMKTVIVTPSENETLNFPAVVDKKIDQNSITRTIQNEDTHFKKSVIGKNKQNSGSVQSEETKFKRFVDGTIIQNNTPGNFSDTFKKERKKIKWKEDNEINFLLQSRPDPDVQVSHCASLNNAESPQKPILNEVSQMEDLRQRINNLKKIKVLEQDANSSEIVDSTLYPISSVFGNSESEETLVSLPCSDHSETGFQNIKPIVPIEPVGQQINRSICEQKISQVNNRLLKHLVSNQIEAPLVMEAPVPSSSVQPSMQISPFERQHVPSALWYMQSSCEIDRRNLQQALEEENVFGILSVLRKYNGKAVSIGIAFQVYEMFKRFPRGSNVPFGCLVGSSVSDTYKGLPIPYEILSTIGVNLMQHEMITNNWRKAHDIYSRMRIARIEIQDSVIFSKEKFSHCRKVLACTEVCLQVEALAEAANILKWNGLMSPNSEYWRIQHVQEDVEMWTHIATKLLLDMIMKDHIVLAAKFFIDIFKAQMSLSNGLELSEFSNLLMVKLLDGNFEEVIELYLCIADHYRALEPTTYRALLVMFVRRRCMDKADNLFKASLCMNIYPRPKVSRPLYVIIYSYLLLEEIYVILKDFFNKLAEASYSDLVDAPDCDNYRSIIKIESLDVTSADGEEVCPVILKAVDKSNIGAQKRICTVLQRYFPEIVFELQNNSDLVVLEPQSLINCLKSVLFSSEVVLSVSQHW